MLERILQNAIQQCLDALVFERRSHHQRTEGARKCRPSNRLFDEIGTDLIRILGLQEGFGEAVVGIGEGFEQLRTDCALVWGRLGFGVVCDENGRSIGDGRSYICKRLYNTV